MAEYMNLDGLADYHPTCQHSRVDRVEDFNDASATLDTTQPLDIEPHVLFRISKWRNLSWIPQADSLQRIRDTRYDVDVEFYQRVYPALQLATILISRANPFLVRVYSGPVIQDPNFAPYFDRDWIPKPEDYTFLDTHLIQMAQYTHIFPIDEAVYATGRAIGITASVPNLDASLPPPRPRNTPDWLINVGICLPLLAKVCSNDWVTSMTDKQRSSVLGEIALTLIHELAHGLWKTRRHMLDPSVALIQEPSFNEPISELGHAVTTYLFGFEWALPTWHCHPRGTPNDPLVYIAEATQFDGATGLIAMPAICHPAATGCQLLISFRTILSLFEKSTWEGNRPFRMQYMEMWDNDYLTVLRRRCEEVWAQQDIVEAVWDAMNPSPPPFSPPLFRLRTPPPATPVSRADGDVSGGP